MRQILAAVLLGVLFGPLGCIRADEDGAVSANELREQGNASLRTQDTSGDPEGKTMGEGIVMADDISLTVVYDNNEGRPGLEPAWGFGCVIDGLDQRILFDTGGDGAILLGNMSKLGSPPSSIDVVVLSHFHQDHTGGIEEFLKMNPDVRVYVPRSFPSQIKERARELGAEVVELVDAAEVIPGALTSGVLSGPSGIDEQSLVINTDRGAVVITGCAHPGIEQIVKRAKQLTGKEILLAIGGFHLLRDSEEEIAGVVSGLESIGVRFIAPCHCTVSPARKVFEKRFETGFVQTNVGSTIELNQLAVLGD
jgi:7,8-dihydropterin-6-yl-methyl-4-(beta-D-ribofuranosyl)aminobenzene 5'-phosphate synthase